MINYQLPISNYQKGFALVELLVSIGIIVLLSAVLLPSLSGFGRRDELAQNAKLVQSKILEAKSYALAPRTAGGVSITHYSFIAPVASFLADCPADPARYAVVEISSGGNNVISCESLSSGIVFSSSEQEVRFSVEGQGAISSPATDVTFQVRHTRLTEANLRNIVVIRATGQVRIETP